MKTLSTVALIVALLCFFVALLLTSHVVVGSGAASWRNGGFIALVIALLLGSRP